MIKNIIIDFKRTIYNPDSDSLLEDALLGLNLFREKGFYIRLVGKGVEAEIISILKRFKIDSFFDDICISDDKEKFFNKVDEPSSWLVIGDRAHKEILFGGQLNMNTLWLKNGKFSTEEPQVNQKKPDYIVSTWNEIIEIIKKI
ncbi:MAG: HAD hydrolase-like protein [Patescibacteria group bacterium]